MKTISLASLLSLGLSLGVLAQASLEKWNVPLGGNAYLTHGQHSHTDRVTPQGITWQNQASVFSAYVHIDKAAELDLSLRVRVPEGKSSLKVEVVGKSFSLKAEGAEFQVLPIGRIHAKPGYLKINVSGVEKSAAVFAEVSDIIVNPLTQGVKASFARNNDGNMFYWARRGPSVHLNYQVPNDKNIAYAYSELHVPAGEDVPGSYYMANGFGQGYFGIQVKSATERWVLFSVWSPHHTDRPADVPVDKRITLLKKGADVRGGEFGGEGSGGQSVLVYPWKADVTYKFLLGVKPDGFGNTIYTAWFGEAGKPDWQLIASFKRPQINTWLTGYHSFLENFYDMNGFMGRRAYYGNQWVCDTDGTWHEVTTAHFTGDGTAGGGHRLDYAGGTFKSGFFMRNGGFFNERVALNQSFTRTSTPDRKPKIDFKVLEKL